MRKILFALISVATLALVGCDDNYTPSVSLDKAFKDRYPTATQVEWEREHGHRVADFYINGQECEAWYTRDGRWVMTLFDIEYSDLPAAVKAAFEVELAPRRLWMMSSAWSATMPIRSISSRPSRWSMTDLPTSTSTMPTTAHYCATRPRAGATISTTTCNKVCRHHKERGNPWVASLFIA